MWSIKICNKLVIDKEVSWVIEEIFDKYSKGYTRTEIVKSLNDRKIMYTSTFFAKY